MTVRIRKPEVNLREKINELDKPVGRAGAQMLRAETPQEQFNLINAGRRNLIINGSFDVWQRGESASVNQSSVFVADRTSSSFYNTGFGSSTPGTVLKRDITGTTLDGVTFNNALGFYPQADWKLSYTWQRLEDVTMVCDTTITMSMWMRASKPITLRDQARCTQDFGSGGSTSVTTNVPWTRDVTTEWKKFSVTMYVPGVAGKTIGNNNFTTFYIFNSVDLSSLYSSGWIEVTGWQVEIGKVATPFEKRHIGEELALCQRYYQLVTTTIRPHVNSDGSIITTILHDNLQIPITMRAAPAVSIWGDRGFTKAVVDGATNVLARMTNNGDYSGDINDNQTVAYDGKWIFVYMNLTGAWYPAPIYLELQAEL